jgi:TusA-related sulfurtransferase
MVTVNAMGDKCPLPVIKTKKALDALTAPETIEVLVDNETAVANVTKMAQSTGATVTQEKLGENEYKVTIQALAGEGTQTAPAGAVAAGAAGAFAIALATLGGLEMGAEAELPMLEDTRLPFI